MASKRRVYTKQSAPHSGQSFSHSKLGSVRIIGGRWRGRKLKVQQADGLRPTSNRLKETLFNWLQFELADRLVLDLFAGTGSLGFEALSRGAKKAVFVETNKAAVRQLQANIEILQTNQAEVQYQDALEFLAQPTQDKFGMVFIDPPFQQDLLPQLLPLLEPWLAPEAFIYLEFEAGLQINPSLIPNQWRLFRDKKVGESQALLYRLLPSDQAL